MISTPQVVSVTCIKNDSPTVYHNWILEPNRTKLVHACRSASERSEELGAELFHEARNDGQAASIGISVESNAAAPASLAVYGLARRIGNNYQSIRFIQTGTLNSLSSVFEGIPTGPTTQLSQLNFVPYIGLVNFGSTPAHTTISYSSTALNDHVGVQVATPTVPPFTAIRMSLKGLRGDPDLQNSFIVLSDGGIGQVISTMGAEVASNDALWVEDSKEDRKKSTNGGQHPWQITNDLNSYLLLFNSETVPLKVGIHLYAEGEASLSRTLSLSPLQTTNIDLKAVFYHDQKATESKGRLG